MGVGVHHFLKDKDTKDYYVVDRSISTYHVGLSIVATDIGSDFPIGLGGVEFTMGLASSWLLFTGLISTWLFAVLIVPRIKKIDAKRGMITYPSCLRFRYNEKVALVTALILGIGYLGFTGAQIFSSAKLASVTILQSNPFGMDLLLFVLLTIGAISVAYMVSGLFIPTMGTCFWKYGFSVGALAGMIGGNVNIAANDKNCLVS